MRDNAAPGGEFNWQAEVILGRDAEEYTILYHQCGLCALGRQEGLPQLVKYLCSLDTMSIGWMGGALYRTQTLAAGGDCCDFYICKGVYLSGGEQQRIAIARALLKDAPIILLDEATASLDAENETEIQQAISRLVEQKTVLIIAHRMRTVENANKIVVLSGGTVAEMGTPEELMKQGGAFARMVKLQTESQNWTLT